MRDTLDRLLREATLLTLALGIALGWALFQVADGVSTLVGTLLTDFPEPSDIFNVTSSAPLSWEVGGRLLVLWPLVSGLIQLAVVLAVAALIPRRRDIANPS
jgi:hypothetical protein